MFKTEYVKNKTTTCVPWKEAPAGTEWGGSKHIVSPDAGGAGEGRRGEHSCDRLSSQGRALKEARTFH